MVHMITSWRLTCGGHVLRKLDDGDIKPQHPGETSAIRLRNLRLIPRNRKLQGWPGSSAVCSLPPR